MSFTNVPEFKVDLSAFAEKFKARRDLVIQRLTIELMDSIILGTPVDTGRARANWNLALDEPDTSTTLEAENLGKKQGAPINYKSINKALAPETMAVLKEFSGNRFLFITNSLPYIQALENGHSTQAPTGMVKVALLTIESKIQIFVQSLP